MGSEQLGLQGVQSAEASYLCLPTKPQFKSYQEETYRVVREDAGFSWGQQQLYNVPNRAQINIFSMEPHANVTNCGYLSTNRPDFNASGPIWYRKPKDDEQTLVKYTLDSIR